MQIIFLSYANSRTDPLPTLREEEEQVYSLLARRSKQQHFNIHRDAFTSVTTIIEYLELHREEIIVFSYSGHAERDGLLLDAESANAAGLAGLLGQCPRLALIVLNGCSTAGQVERLLKLPNRPVVIATSAPVGDNSATRFGISFFRTLAERHETLEKAFQSGLNAARTSSKREIRESRGIGLETPREEREGSEHLWGIYADRDSDLHWKLPVAAEEVSQRQQTIVWLKWWSGYLLVGFGLLVGSVFLQIAESPLWLQLIPVIFFFAPLPATVRTRLPKKRLYLLIGMHAVLYFLLLFFWMEGWGLIYLILLILGSAAYFALLPLLNGRRTPSHTRS